MDNSTWFNVRFVGNCSLSHVIISVWYAFKRFSDIKTFVLFNPLIIFICVNTSNFFFFFPKCNFTLFINVFTQHLCSFWRIYDVF